MGTFAIAMNFVIIILVADLLLVTGTFLGDEEKYDNSTSCSYSDGIMNCSRLELKSVSIFTNTSESTRIRILIFSYNHITKLDAYTFQSMHQLENLNLSHNRLITIDKNAFQGLEALTVLDLSTNKLTDLPSTVFGNLRRLVYLHIGDNQISTIAKYTFVELERLKDLSIADNRITEITRGMFRGVEQLRQLDLKNNPFGKVETGALKALNLHCLCASDQRFCCLVGSTTSCLAPKFQFSNCRNLTENSRIRVFVWILAIVAILNNIFVIFIRSLHRGDTNRVNSFLVKNLALSDLFMGVYLLIIAYAELLFAENYGENDYEWRNSASCYFAGFLSTFASELTVFILTVMSLDRLFVITFPLRCQQRGLRSVSYFISLCWILALIIAAIPLPIFNIQYFEKFYSRSGVCLALHLTPESAPGWQYSIFVFIVLNAIAFFIIAISYFLMYRVIRKSGENLEAINRISTTTMATRMTLIVSVNAACWTPIIVLGIRSIAGYPITDDVYAWVAQFVLPLNAALNPILYTLSSPQLITLLCTSFRAIFNSLSNSTKTEQINTESDNPLANSKPTQNVISNQQSAYEINPSTLQFTSRAIESISQRVSSINYCKNNALPHQSLSRRSSSLDKTSESTMSPETTSLSGVFPIHHIQGSFKKSEIEDVIKF